MEVDLKSVIAPIFYPVYRAFKNEEYTHYWLKGGRSSTKSSFISIAIIMGMLRDQLANAVIFMKTAANLRQAVFEQFLWAINILNLNAYFDSFLSPLKIVYKPTKQIILFRGLDDANKTKSIKIATGYFKFAWFEELSEFDNMNEIRTTLNSVFRKGDASINPHFSVFYSYNPPRSPKNWVNGEVKVNRADRLVNHSTYLDIPRSWLTDAFIDEANHLKEVDLKSYNHEYMGEVVGVDGLVYPMFDRRKHVIDKLDSNERVYNIILGIDEGTINDATAGVAIMATTKGRIVIPQPFVYDPSLSEHQPLSHKDQALLLIKYVMGLVKEFNYYDNLGTVGTILGYIDSSESGQQLGININQLAQSSGVALEIAKVPKKDILADVQRLRGLFSLSDYCVIMNGPYISPLTNKKISDENPLIEELESMIMTDKGKPEDGHDHCENALRYGSYLLKEQGGL